MPYLMHIALDNPFRFRGRVHYFEYNGIRFKLVQNNPQKWSDVLLTITEGARPHPSVQVALTAASEFASALAWELDTGMSIRHIGGPGIRPAIRLKNAQCVTFVFPELPYRGAPIGFDLTRIAKI